MGFAQDGGDKKSANQIGNPVQRQHHAAMLFAQPRIGQRQRQQGIDHPDLDHLRHKGCKIDQTQRHRRCRRD